MSNPIFLNWPVEFSKAQQWASFIFGKNIDDVVNSSSILSFRMFVDDANIFYANKDHKELELIMNNEL